MSLIEENKGENWYVPKPLRKEVSETTNDRVNDAAPELLAACKMFLNVWLSGEDNWSSDRALKVGAAVKSAVAKAIGKP